MTRSYRGWRLSQALSSRWLRGLDRLGRLWLDARLSGGNAGLAWLDMARFAADFKRDGAQLGAQQVGTQVVVGASRQMAPKHGKGQP